MFGYIVFFHSRKSAEIVFAVYLSDLKSYKAHTCNDSAKVLNKLNTAKCSGRGWCIEFM